MTIPSKNMSDPCKTYKKPKLVFIAVHKCKKNVNLHYQAAEKNIILNDVQYLKSSKSFFLSRFNI